MRVALVLVALLVAGCASSSPPSTEQTRTPPSNASAIATPTPSAAQDEVVLAYNESFANATRQLNQTFSVAKGHWLCVVTNVTAASGEAVVALEGPASSGWVTLATPQNLSSDRMVPWIDGAFVAHLNLTDFSGRVAILVTNEA